MAVRQRDVFLLSHLLEILPFASRWPRGVQGGQNGVLVWMLLDMKKTEGERVCIDSYTMVKVDGATPKRWLSKESW